MRLNPAILSSVIVGVIACAVPARAETPSALQRCYPAEALASTPSEVRVARGDRRFDLNQPPMSLMPTPAIPNTLRGAVRRVELPAGEKLIALTFDLCEQRGEVAGYDGAIFDYLRQEGIKATVFAGGKWMRSHGRRAAQLMLDPLVELANHSDTHKNLRTLDAAAMEGEIRKPQWTYEALRTDVASRRCVANEAGTAPVVPPRMTLFRFPFGACNQASLDAVNDAGLLAIQWDVSTGDPSPGQSAAAIARAIVKGATPGSIVIMHANGRGWHTAAALPLAIPKLKSLGFEFVTVSELLARGKPVISETCYNARPGDTDRYDHPLLSLAKKAKPVAASRRKPDAE